MAASNLFIIAHHMNNYKSVKEMRHDCTSQCTFNCLFILYKSFSFLMHQLAGKNCRFQMCILDIGVGRFKLMLSFGPLQILRTRRGLKMVGCAFTLTKKTKRFLFEVEAIAQPFPHFKDAILPIVCIPLLLVTFYAKSASQRQEGSDFITSFVVYIRIHSMHFGLIKQNFLITGC